MLLLRRRSSYSPDRAASAEFPELLDLRGAAGKDGTNLEIPAQCLDDFAQAAQVHVTNSGQGEGRSLEVLVPEP